MRTQAERDLGLSLGRLHGREIYAYEDDVILLIAGPRSNKTSAQVVPAVLTASGPVITTSNDGVNPDSAPEVVCAEPAALPIPPYPLALLA